MSNDNQNFINSDANHLSAAKIAESYTSDQIKQLLKDAPVPPTQSLQAAIVTNYRAKLEDALKIQSEKTIVQSPNEENTILQAPEEFIGPENLIDVKISEAIDALDEIDDHDEFEDISAVFEEEDEDIDSNTDTESKEEEAEQIEEIDESDVVDLNAREFLEIIPIDKDRMKIDCKLPIFAVSHIGIPKNPDAKSVNQDYTCVTDSIAIVCDGVGSGQKSDEIAKEFADRIADKSNQLASVSSVGEGLIELNSVLTEINQELKSIASNDEVAYEGSGSTLAGIVRLKDGRKMVFTLGDSEVLKISNSGEIQSLTNPLKDTIFGIVLTSIGIRDISDIMDLDLSSFINKLKQNFKSIDSTLEDQAFLDVLAQNLQSRFFNTLRKFLRNEDTFRAGRQVIAKGALGDVQVDQTNLVILKQEQSDHLLAVTDGLTDQMTYQQISEVFLYGGIKSLINKFKEEYPKITQLKFVKELMESESIVDLEVNVDLKKLLKTINKIINPKKLFRGINIEKAAQIDQIIKEGGTHELLIESIANMQNDRLGIDGYKRPKADNITITTL